MTDSELTALTGRIIGAAMKVHTALGPGLLESAYETCLKYELVKQGFRVETQREQPVIYEEVELDCGYRIDMLVENIVVVELKCVDEFVPIHEAQLLSYLKLSERPVGLLINFHALRLRDGIKRMRN